MYLGSYCLCNILQEILLLTVSYILHLCVVCIILQITKKCLGAQDHKAASYL